MGFFKEFKDDISQAVTELIPEEVFDDNQVVNTLEYKSENDDSENDVVENIADTFEDDNVDMDILDAILTQDESTEDSKKDEKSENKVKPELELKMEAKLPTNALNRNEEVTIITKGTTITGSISSDGSLEVNGTIKGDIECQGKLSIIGIVSGNCMAAEVYVGAKRLVGCINSEGSVKIGLGTVVIGDVTASSGVIAGAIKGEIDINGPIVIDSSAVIKGNIKAQSIQINNGAVIEGFCSLSYSSIDIDNIFE